MKKQTTNNKYLWDALLLVLDISQPKKNLWRRIISPDQPQILKQLKQTIILAKKNANKELLNTLDNIRFQATVHHQDNQTRSVIQNVILAYLFYDGDFAKKDKQAFLDDLAKAEAIEAYKNYYRKQRSIYGRFIERFSDEEITLAAKGGIINGKLVENMGLKKSIAHGLQYIRNELVKLQKQKEAGFLKHEAINNYIEKLDYLLNPANEIYHDDKALLQNARYLLEDIINAAGIEENATAKYIIHQPLISSCYWVDEMFKVAKGQIEADSLV